MLARVDSAELSQWMAFWSIDPWGGTRGDWQAATVAACVVNMLRGDGRHSSPEEFVPRFGRVDEEAEKRRRLEARKAAFRVWARACGGEVKGG